MALFYLFSLQLVLNSFILFHLIPFLSLMSTLPYVRMDVQGFVTVAMTHLNSLLIVDLWAVITVSEQKLSYILGNQLLIYLPISLIILNQHQIDWYYLKCTQNQYFETLLIVFANELQHNEPQSSVQNGIFLFFFTIPCEIFTSPIIHIKYSRFMK